MVESDDDVPQLRADSLAALKEFYQEKVERECKFKKLLEQSEKDFEVEFEENWQLSQFWYDEKTVETMTKGIVKCTENHARIGLISCPTLYKALIKIAGNRQVKIFEFDERFSVFGSDFILYDYKNPLNVPDDLHESFDLVVCDPPFLSEECLTNVASTIKLLTKKNVILCSGSVMQDLAEKLLALKKCNFQPHHKNNLANEFWCYSNFDLDKYLD
ncbi:EEF1A lysine methyltransferase 1 [Copidosoma floridanum]|uniref:EEF1A lysine methyltransferase 1 n=1 Tax=Copidosoma floridanum TaxID=29053 RepID=UPI0006C9C688|nr:EEF1A lysine methyltransferase 1 [Copidosoma floridanum]